MANKTKGSKLHYWREVVSNFRKSNLSVSEFSNQHDISPHQLSYWKTKLQNSDNQFVEVVKKSSNTSELSISVGNLITISFAAPPSPEWVSKLIKEVQRAA